MYTPKSTIASIRDVLGAAEITHHEIAKNLWKKILFVLIAVESTPPIIANAPVSKPKIPKSITLTFAETAFADSPVFTL